MTFNLRGTEVPDGTVLVMGVQYESQTTDKVWEYALLKASGLWYVTGNAKTPTAAGWGAVERWLAKDGRILRWVKVATEMASVYPSPGAPEPTAIVAQLKRQTSRVDTSQATE